MAPSTFASAAAGNHSSQNTSRDTASEWSRRTNGATQTFRRASGVPTSSNAPASNDHAAPTPARYVPPHRNGTTTDTRYSKEQLLDLYKLKQSALKEPVSDLFVGGWHPETSNGASTPAWGRTDPGRDTQAGAEVCWDNDAANEPLGLIEMDEEERELFTTSVNTPIKPPTTGKDGPTANGLPGRKASISTGGATSGGFGAPSPSVTRGGGRRREASESYPFPQSQGGSSAGFNRDDSRTASPPPSLLRRRTDMKDPNRTDDADDKPITSPFGTLKRNPTGPIGTSFAASTSPWSAAPSSAGLSPMGAFGNFGLGSAVGQQSAPGEKRPGMGAGRTESRFKNVLSKDTSDESGNKSVESKTSVSNLSKVHESDSWRSQDVPDTSEATGEGDDSLRTGSAALVADADVSPPQPRQGYRGFGTPSRQGTQDDYGFGAFGMTANAGHGFGPGFLQGRESYQQTPAQQRGGGNEPMSPTDTNPYQSPDPHGADRSAEANDNDNSELQSTHLPGLGGFGAAPSPHLGGLSGLGALASHSVRGSGPVGSAGDRSQTSSVGPGRGFSGLSGLGGLPSASAWSVPQGGLGTPGRQSATLSNAFNGGLFMNSMEVSSPGGLAGLGGPGIMGSSGSSFGGSRLASMFPQTIQDQSRQNDSRSNEIGRQSDSPFISQSFPDGRSDASTENQPGPFGAPGQPSGQSVSAHSQGVGGSTSAQPPAPQQRTMVMPDRMRWIYRDPQGQTQGPWSGLEMHDWYKAGFFSPELLVKKYEDQDYEPLAQLIRRIGNSREPFLVPQIGIPHGDPVGNGPNAWAGSGSVTGNGQGAAGGAQPPFASSFPSFGTTLTADQQNALERRKQEEQYLMARQKEHLAQAQLSQRFQMQGGAHPGLLPGQLHHHSSAHSLHSQPSFGSITGPAGVYPAGAAGSAGITNQSGFYDHSFRAQQPPAVGAIGTGVDALGQIREEDVSGMMDRLQMNNNRAPASQYGAPGQPFSVAHGHPQEKQGQQMLQDRARLQQEQAEMDTADDEDEEVRGPNERLKQFEQLQDHKTSEERFRAAAGQPVAASSTQQGQTAQTSASQSSISSPLQEPVSLKQQGHVKPESSLPQPFPAPTSSKPQLAAPEPQRPGRPIVAEHLQKEPRDQSETPSLESKVAPWATKDLSEAPRGPSLKEIQELEAKQAAKAEELATAARRAALQKAMEAEAQASAVQPGLPAAANWAAGSPSTPTGSSAAAWAKTAQKSTGPAPAKSMAQIQKEEEARKRKLAAATATAQAHTLGGVTSPAGTKSYANLAGKVTASAAPSSSGGAWTTVGAGGKTKTPAAGVPATTSRTVSASVLPTLQPSSSLRKPPSRSSTMIGSGGVNAQDEFKKWAANELRPDLSKGISAEDFVSSLTMLPPEADIITEAVHGVSSTIDSRHFAEEFLRRKKLADKGMVDSAPLKTASPHNAGDGKSGGWNEVAKKGPSKEAPKEETSGNGLFRVVAAKKKGGKR